MLTKKSRMTSLVAIAATVMLVFSTNAASAATASGRKLCTQNQTGVVYAHVAGSGKMLPPGNSTWKHFSAPSRGALRTHFADVPRGGNWKVSTFGGALSNAGAYCETGRP